MKIASPNVFIGFGVDIIEKIMSDSYKYSNLVKDLEKNNNAGLLFSVESNPNFIYFEHELGLGANATSQMTLQFIDTNRQFERRFISYNIIDSIFNKNTMNILQDTGRFKSTKNATPEDEEVSLLSSKYLIEQARNSSARHLYVCYGFGEDLKNWAGPFAVTISGSKIDIQGSKVITLKLVPSTTTLDSNTLLDAYGNTPEAHRSQEPQVKGYSQPIEFLGEFADVYKLNGDPHNIDFHLILNDTLKSFISNASQIQQCIVLLPNINEICKTSINSIIDRYPLPTPPPRGLAGTPGNTIDPVYFSQTPYDTFINNMKIVNEVFKRFNLELVQTSTTDETIPTGGPSIYSSSNTTELIEQYINSVTYKVRAATNIQRSDSSLNYLNSIIDAINKMNDNSPIIPEYVIENNMHILRFWKEESASESFTFRKGYGAGNEIFSDNEVPIFADRDLMTKYLYCTEDSQSTETDKIKPLYPKNERDLGSKKYKSKIQRIIQKSDSDFFQVYSFPDDFALNHSEIFSTTVTDAIKDLKVPIFKFNTKNSNITSISFLNSDLYATTLNTSYKRYLTALADKSEQAVKFIESKRSTKNIKNEEELYKYIRSSKILNYDSKINPEYIVSLLDPEFRQTFGKGSDFLLGFKRDNTDAYSNEELLLVIEALSVYLSQPEFLPELPLEQFTQQDKRVVILDFLRQVNELMFQIEIETVPIFSLNNMGNIGKPCLLFCQNSEILQTKKNASTDNFLKTLGTGFWKIGRFKHTISGTECRSSFSLFKGDLTSLQELPKPNSGQRTQVTAEDVINEARAVLED